MKLKKRRENIWGGVDAKGVNLVGTTRAGQQFNHTFLSDPQRVFLASTIFQIIAMVHSHLAGRGLVRGGGEQVVAEPGWETGENDFLVS